jgi:hypothetical protein
VARSHVLLVAAMALVLVGLSGASAQAAVHRQTDPVRRFSDGSVVQGAWSTLITRDTGPQFTLTTNGLAPRHEVTVWWVIFNHRENCTHGALGLRCGEGDLFVPSVEASVQFGAGHVIGGSGMASYGAYLGVGDTAGALFGPGLLDPLSGDIHLVVRPRDPFGGPDRDRDPQLRPLRRPGAGLPGRAVLGPRAVVPPGGTEGGAHRPRFPSVETSAA